MCMLEIIKINCPSQVLGVTHNACPISTYPHLVRGNLLKGCIYELIEVTMNDT